MGTRDFGTDLYVQKGTLVPGKRWNVDDIKATVKGLLGANMVVDESGQFSADNYFSATDSRHGLHFTIRGRAENVMVDIATHLAQFTDPINLVLGKRITRNYKVVVTRHEMMGGRVEQVPERAPARLVTSREVKTEVELARYGNDVTIDTNLLASPEDFAADVNRKVTFQKQQFQQKLIELGYECLMNESTNLIPALARSIPSGNVTSSYKMAMERYYNDCFAAFNYHGKDAAGNDIPPTNRIAKILQHVRMASTATASPMTVMIVPAGADLNGYQREPDAHFKVTGIKQNELAPVTFPLPSIVTDPITNLQIGVHYPLMNYDRGTRNPQASVNTGLTETGYLFVQTDDTQKIPMPPNKLVVKDSADKTYLNFGYDVGTGLTGEALGLGDSSGAKTPTFGRDANKTAVLFATAYGEVVGDTTIKTEEEVGDKINTVVINEAMFDSLKAAYMRLYADDCYEFVSSSAIVAAPGPDTGEMLVAYPQTTAHSVEVAPEEMKMQMRAYLGAAIYNSANVIRIPHVLIESLEKIEKAGITGEFASNVMTVSQTRANQIAKRIGKNDTFIHTSTSGAFVDPSAATSGGGGVAPSSGGGAVSSGDAVSSGEVIRKKKSSKA